MPADAAEYSVGSLEWSGPVHWAVAVETCIGVEVRYLHSGAGQRSHCAVQVLPPSGQIVEQDRRLDDQDGFDLVGLGRTLPS